MFFVLEDLKSVSPLVPEYLLQGDEASDEEMFRVIDPSIFLEKCNSSPANNSSAPGQSTDTDNSGTNEPATSSSLQINNVQPVVSSSVPEKSTEICSTTTSSSPGLDCDSDQCRTETLLDKSSVDQSSNILSVIPEHGFHQLLSLCDPESLVHLLSLLLPDLSPATPLDIGCLQSNGIASLLVQQMSIPSVPPPLLTGGCGPVSSLSQSLGQRRSDHLIVTDDDGQPTNLSSSSSAEADESTQLTQSVDLVVGGVSPITASSDDPSNASQMVKKCLWTHFINRSEQTIGNRCQQQQLKEKVFYHVCLFVCLSYYCYLLI